MSVGITGYGLKVTYKIFRRNKLDIGTINQWSDGRVRRSGYKNNEAKFNRLIKSVFAAITPTHSWCIDNNNCKIIRCMN